MHGTLPFLPVASGRLLFAKNQFAKERAGVLTPFDAFRSSGLLCWPHPHPFLHDRAFIVAKFSFSVTMAFTKTDKHHHWNAPEKNKFKGVPSCVPAGCLDRFVFT